MKKTKQISLVRTLIAAVLLLIGSSGGVAWGQTYIGIQGNNTGTTTTTGANAVNNVFGAGESAKIENNDIHFPGSVRTVNSSPYKPLIIGEIAGSPSNIVINSYNGGGQIQGWVNEFIYTWRSGTTSHCGSLPNDPGTGSGTWSPVDPAHSDAGTYIGLPLRATTSPPSWGGSFLHFNHGQNHSWSSNLSGTHVGGTSTATVSDGSDPRWAHSFGSWWRFSPYVTDKSGLDKDDDAIHLVQTRGDAIYNLATYGTKSTPKTPGDGLELYRRPTTVGVSGANQFENLFIYDLPWYYQTFAVTTYSKTDASDVASYDHETRSNSKDCACDHLGVCHDYMHYRQRGGLTVLHRTFDVTWDNITEHIKAMKNSNQPLLLDAAIAILGGADVCVRNDVKDNTTKPQSNTGYNSTNITDVNAPGFDETDALLIWPESGQNFQLKVRGHFYAMNMFQKSLSGNPPYYEANNFPKNSQIQNSAIGASLGSFSGGNMFLYPGSKTFNVVETASGLDAAYANVPLPYTTTKSGVLGVYKSYSDSNAYVHTGATAGANNPGVIEIGPATDITDAAKKGWNRFVIYSGGTIKNYRTDCNDTYCDSIKFANKNSPNNGSPKFILDNTASLNILNDGFNCCGSAIVFANDDAIKEITGEGLTSGGVKNAGNTGDLLIRAHGYTALDGKADFDATSKNNNVFIFSDKAFIRTQDFKYNANGSAEKGRIYLWAKGGAKQDNPSNCGGAVTVHGKWETLSGFTPVATSWQRLHEAIAVLGGNNSGSLARFANCGASNEIMSARTAAALETGVQTRIQSDNDSVLITGDFKHQGQDGGLLVQGARSVTIGGKTEIDFKTKSGVGDAVIQSKNSSVWFNNEFSYIGNVTTDLFIDGETGVTFNSASGPSTIDYTQGTDPTAHIGIQSNSGTIAFRNNPFTFKSKSTGETQLWAGANITSTNNAPLLFDYTKATASTPTPPHQNIDWYAGNAIDLRGTLTFKRNDAEHLGYIKLRANANAEGMWVPSGIPNGQRCPTLCDPGNPNKGDIFLRNDVKVDYKGKENVWMAANHDINIQRNYTHVAGTGQDPQGFTRFVAGHDIITGEESAVPLGTYGTTFSYLHMGDKGGNFDMKAGHDIITHNKVNIAYNAAANDALVTTLFACNNIDIRNKFWYTDSTQTATHKQTRLYANNDILTNSTCLNHPAPVNGGAPVNYYTPFDTRTEWNAGQNIITKDSVNFRYGNTQHNVSDLSLVAQGGNIEMWRWTNVNYDSDSLILFSAERNKNYSQAVKAHLTATGGDRSNGGSPDAPRFERDGHIYFNDSANITRNNEHDGTTKIFADYHIRTAIMSIKNTQPANENKTTIESHLGDIWLGYSVKKPDGCATPGQSDISYNNNLFLYKDAANSKTQSLKIRAGYQDQGDTSRYNGGNIYVVQMRNELTKGGTTNTEITIPFSNEYKCGSTWSSGLLHNRQKDTMMMYEHAGIIFGLGHCGRDEYIDNYAPGIPHGVVDPQVTKLSLEHRGNKGNLLVDAGKRGNIIINKGANLNFQDTLNMTGDAIFRTRFGDIDMREKFDADTMRGSLLFLAQTENLSDLSKIGICGCEEERNNVYLQDFQYRSHMAGGSVFVGADNNIKLNYGGLQNIGTRHDPFLSKDYTVCPDGKLAKIGYGYDGASCNDDDLHCDAVEPVNKARKLILNFKKDDQNKAITKGGFAAVASDYIDVYKKMVYRGGRGSGMSSVPGTGTLHGETVNGYGLFMKTQANKNNWTINIFKEIPKCPTTCAGDNCDRDYLHMVSRMTFHDEADIQAHNQKVMLWSPVVETYGKMTLDTKTNSGNNTEITLKADSLIFHDDFVKIGNKTKLSTWSGLKNDKPIMKFGHMRKTPPFRELKKDNCQTEIECIPCHYYIRGSKDPVHMLDTITIKFGDDAYLERLNTVVFDHTVLTCLTDSFDHIKGAPVLNAQVRTDTLKIRNQVDLFADKNHERDAHLELISERQMGSKDYAGIYTKHLHMEPVGACGTPYSELWTSDDLALDVITTSIFGGFGFIHSDVHVENGAHLNAGFTSLRLRGLCYEQLCGTQRMKDLRLDVGAQLHFSVGTTKGLNGEYSDAIEVEKLTTYGSVDVNIEIRPCEKMEKRCYPIIYYKSLTPNSLNNLKVKPATVKIDGQDYPLHLNIGTDGIVYVCVGDAQPVDLTRTVTIPTVAGVKTDPAPGIWEVKSRGNFKFKATYTGKPLAVRTSRMVNGAPEMLTGKKNANGEYEYVIPHVQEDITLTIGPDFVANELLAGTAVWSHGEMIYIRVDRADIASIYSVAGQLVRKIDLPEGDTSIPMSRGAYVITLKDGSVHKVIVK